MGAGGQGRGDTERHGPGEKGIRLRSGVCVPRRSDKRYRDRYRKEV